MTHVERAGWTNDVKGIVENLKKDFGLWDSIPFVAGELRYDGCCPGHNKLINQLPGMIPNCAVASANGLERRLSRTDGQYDQYHFSTKRFKEFGFRFAEAFLKLVDQDYMPRINTTANSPQIHGSMKNTVIEISWNKPVGIYTLSGRFIATVTNRNQIRSHLKSGNVYIIYSTIH